MEFRTNVSSLAAQRALGSAVKTVTTARERLASGMRINAAADDAAGLAIAETLKADVRILGQSIRNASDGTSLLSIADGALEQLGALLTRGAELAEQAANGVYGPTQKQNLHLEAAAIVEEIDRIAATTEFNQLKILQIGSNPFATEEIQILNGLQSSWLEQSENLIQTHYGLIGDGAPLDIQFVNNVPQYLAAVSGTPNGTGKLINQTLLVDLADFAPATLPNGGTAPFYDDRIIAHEMVHAVMGRTMNFTALPTWFIEGTAEFMHGADERLNADIFNNGGPGVGEAAVANEIDQPWTGSSLQYSSGYSAVRYLHDRIITAGGTGIRDIMTYLNANQSDDLDDALQNIASGGYAAGLNGVGGFYEDFKTLGNGVTFIQGLNLANADTGAIGGADADGGARVTTATGTIPDTVNSTLNPLAGFVENWPVVDTSNGKIAFQIGLKGQDYIEIDMLQVTAANLGLSGIDLVNNAPAGLDAFKAALQLAAEQRGKIGSTQSRINSIVNNNTTMSNTFSEAESRIRDADIAAEAADVARGDILTKSATEVLKQANLQPQIVLQLLKEI